MFFIVSSIIFTDSVPRNFGKSESASNDSARPADSKALSCAALGCAYAELLIAPLNRTAEKAIVHSIELFFSFSRHYTD